jgi:hypothetical protein
MRWLFIDYHRYHTSRTSINVIDRSFRPQFLQSPAEVCQRIGASAEEALPQKLLTIAAARC